MTNDSKYQGWTNYETWAVKLWLDNEQGDQEYAQEVVESAWDKDYPWKAGDALRDSLEESMPDLGGMWSDLLRSAWEEVNWEEIAEAYADNLELDTDDTEGGEA